MQEIIDIFNANPIGQTLGILGMIVVISAFLQKDDKNVLKILVIANLFWAGHFYFMGIYSGLAICLVGLVRLLMSMKYKRNKNVFYIIVSVTLLLGIYTYKDSSSILPILASGLSTYGFFFLEKIKLRLVLLLCSSFWFSFHYLHFSIGGVINESIVQVIHLFTIYRIILSEGKTKFYILKLKNLYINRPKVDYGRYLAVLDFIRVRKKK